MAKSTKQKLIARARKRHGNSRFLNSLSNQTYPLTPRQLEVLGQMAPGSGKLRRKLRAEEKTKRKSKFEGQPAPWKKKSKHTPSAFQLAQLANPSTPPWEEEPKRTPPLSQIAEVARVPTANEDAYSVALAEQRSLIDFLLENHKEAGGQFLLRCLEAVQSGQHLSLGKHAMLERLKAVGSY